MGFSAEGLSIAGIGNLLIAFILLLVVAIYLRRYVSVDDEPFSSQVTDRAVLYLLSYLILFLAFLIHAGTWLYHLESGTTFLNPHSARSALYETRSLLAIGLLVSLTSLTFFVPLLVAAWNRFFESVDRYVEELTRLESAKQLSSEARGFLNHINLLYLDLEKLRGKFQFWFAISLAANILVIVAIGCVFFWHDWYQAYVLAVILTGFAIVVLLWFTILLAIFLGEIQPKRGELHKQYRRLLLNGLNGEPSA